MASIVKLVMLMAMVLAGVEGQQTNTGDRTLDARGKATLWEIAKIMKVYDAGNSDSKTSSARNSGSTRARVNTRNQNRDQRAAASSARDSAANSLQSRGNLRGRRISKTLNTQQRFAQNSNSRPKKRVKF